jgi:SAM-dependent methyltransferase
MHLDVWQLRNFYYRTRLGRAAQRAIREQVSALWSEAEAQTVVGFGFAVPLLRPYLGQARRVVALMPGAQGVMPWPDATANIAVLADESAWPLDTGVADKLLVLHGLETSDMPGALLDECWRVLGPGGRALFVLPNRSGLWARGDRTPFGFGRPYSLGQIEAQLQKHGFTPERHLAALFAPPSERRFWLKVGPAWEGIGRRLSGSMAGGVLLVEASKQVFAPRPRGARAEARNPVPVLDGIGAPAPGARESAARRRRLPRCGILPSKSVAARKPLC